MSVTITLLLRAALVAMAVLPVPVARASAEAALRPDLADPVAGRQEVTFADLVRLMPEPTGIRHIDGTEWSSERPEEAGLRHFAAIRARSGGHDRTVLLLDFGSARDSASGFVVLAAFDVAAEPRFLDAVDVAFDRWTSFAEPVRLPVGEGDDLLVTRSTHFNSGQGYATVALILLRDDRFELVDAVSMLDDRACAFERTQQLDVRRGAGAPFADIRAVVTEVTEASGEECGDAAMPEPASRTIAVTYSWDAAARRYIADSDAFAVLARENEKRF